MNKPKERKSEKRKKTSVKTNVIDKRKRKIIEGHNMPDESKGKKKTKTLKEKN
jgi:hypothetical protein